MSEYSKRDEEGGEAEEVWSRNANFLGVSAISLGVRQLWVAGWRKKKPLQDD